MYWDYGRTNCKPQTTSHHHKSKISKQLKAYFAIIEHAVSQESNDYTVINDNKIFKLMFYLLFLLLAAPVREHLISEDCRLHTSSDRFLC